MKDPLLDQGAKAKTVSGHRANSGQQETGRGQFFSHVAPSLPQEVLSLYSVHMLWVKDQDESPTQSLHPCLRHLSETPLPNIPASQSLPRHRQKNVSVNQITRKKRMLVLFTPTETFKMGEGLTNTSGPLGNCI